MTRALPATALVLLGSVGAAAIAAADDHKIKMGQFTVDGFSHAEGYAKCGRGKRAVGGGVAPIGSADNLGVRASGPLDASGNTLDTETGDKANQWYAAVFNNSGFQRVLRVFAICE